MKPGLYRVVTPYLCAGFVVESDGRIPWCAAILRKNLAHWKTVATWIGPDPLQKQQPEMF